MLEHITTPFRRRSLTAAQVTAQADAAACPAETTVDKWAVLRHVAIVRGELGLSDRTLAVLSALLSFHPETALCMRSPNDLVVFPSNAALSMRAHGIDEKTLRRHLAALVEAGLVVRRDSPNGKRYIRRGEGGQIVQAFGFDLAPLVARADLLAAAADRIERAGRAYRIARERLTLARRDLAKLIAYALDHDVPGEWSALQDQAANATAGLGRRAGHAAVEAAGSTLVALVADASKLLANRTESMIQTGSDGQIDRHHQSSKPDLPKSRRGNPAAGEETTGRAFPTYPLQMILEACPDIADYARDGIRSWRDLIDTAGIVRSVLGVSPSGWQEAQEALGLEAAAVLVAAILQRAEHIRSPGGYLRALVVRKRAGEFSLGPVLAALQRRRETEADQTRRNERLPKLSPMAAHTARPTPGD